MPLNEKGQEVPDQEPIVIRVGRKSIQQFDHIKAFIRRELSEAAGRDELETFDEANDFDVEDEEIPQSPHTYTEEMEARERERFEDERDKAKKEFDEHVKRVKRPPAGGNEQGNTPDRSGDAATPLKTKRPRQAFLVELPEED